MAEKDYKFTCSGTVSVDEALLPFFSLDKRGTQCFSDATGKKYRLYVGIEVEDETGDEFRYVHESQELGDLGFYAMDYDTHHFKAS